MKTNLKFIMITLFTIAITACSPEDGKDGTNGEQGIPGQDGNANVESYIFENVALSMGNENIFLLPAITQDIVDNGVVLGYITNSINVAWFPLPYIDGGETLSIFYITPGSLAISSSTDSAELTFKFVLIDGTPGDGSKTSGKSSKEAIYNELKTAGVDLNDYDAVVNYYNSKN